MRARVAVLLTTLGALVLPGVGTAQAAPHRDHGLTIAATPNPIVAGTGVLIYGNLTGANPGGQTVLLWHRVNPAARFTVISKTTTNATGYYQFVRADGVVLSNRNWYVTGPDATHSRVIHERVSAQVSLDSASAQAGTITATTGEPITFTGTVFPAHVGQVIRLQDQNSLTGTGWGTIARSRTTASSTFSITHAFPRPGMYTVQAEFGPDPRNIASDSDTLTVLVQQKQDPTFTINTSSPVIAAGQTATISGTVTLPGSTTRPDPGQSLTLWGHAAGQPLRPIAQTTTGTDGSYSFSVAPVHNTRYVVRFSERNGRHSASLNQGVADTLTAAFNPTNVPVGGQFTATGTVSPDHTGHEILLQFQNASGHWIDMNSGTVGSAGSYSLSGSFGQAGTYTVRVRILGGPYNIGAASQTQTITVSGQASAGSLPAAS